MRNLPHNLVEAFKATLEEASASDLLIHVADASDPEVEIHMATTEKVLDEIGAGAVPRILVLNKADIAEPGVVEQWRRLHPDSLAVSAKTGLGLDALATQIEARLTSGMVEMELAIPFAEYSLIPLIHREGTVLEERTEDDCTVVRCKVPQRIVPKLEPYTGGKELKA